MSTDSTTDTNETEANTVEMFSPPPPYPDELNYQFDLNLNNFDEEHKPFMPHIRHPNRLSQAHLTSSKYLKELNDQLDYPIEYATPIHQSWPSDPTNGKHQNPSLSLLRPFPVVMICCYIH